MSIALTPAFSEIRSTFSLSVTEHGGSVSEVFENEDLLIMRAILPQSDDVKPSDPVNSGVALRCSGRSLEIHPYVFRQVCSNGVIMAQSVASCQLDRIESWQHENEESDTLLQLSQVVAGCATGDAFSRSVDQFRNAGSRNLASMDLMLSMMAVMHGHTALIEMIARDFMRAEDQSAYGLLNAVTATARETTDPETKWTLEKIGGSIPARISIGSADSAQNHTATGPSLVPVA